MDVRSGLDDILLASPLLALVLGSLIPIFLKVFRGNREPNPLAVLLYAWAAILIAGGLNIISINAKRTAFTDALIFDGISSWVGFIVLALVGFCLFLSHENEATKGKHFSEYVFLVLNAAAGMLTMVWANDLIVMFIGLELMSLCLYLLIALSNEENLSKEAAFKYFILGSFASAILLLGLAFIFGTTGTTYLTSIVNVAAELASTNVLFLFGLSLTIIGFCFKVSVFPFHAWAPDVYSGSPTPVTALMATAVKVVSFAAFLRVIATDGLIASERLLFALQWLAVGTMFIGNLAALLQVRLKRMLAYSSIAHSGYAMIGLIAAAMGGSNVLGASSLLFYVFSYSTMTLGAFALISMFETKAETVLRMEDLKGLGHRHPALAVALTLFLLSLAGIPPLVGFFGKFYLFSAALNQGLVWLVVWGVINSVISVYYYLTPIVFMFMHESETGSAETSSLNHDKFISEAPLTRLTIITSAIMVVAFGIVSEPFYKVVVSSVSHLF